MKIKIYFITAAAGLLLFTSCKKELANVNTNPTTVNANEYNANFLLTTSQLMYTGSNDFGAENWQTEWGGIAGYIQHVASINTAYYYGDKYLNSPGNFGVYFDHAYPFQVQPVVELYELTLNKPQYKNLHQMARIMKAMIFERITDIYGDIPYSQAGLGYYERIYTPVYDKQQDIYTDLLKEVSEATDSLDETADKPSGDVFFSNDTSTQISEWKKFGNTLLLRMAMRLTKVDPATAQAYAAKLTGLTMMSNADNAIVQHQLGSETQNRDSWSILLQDSTDLKLCQTFIDSLKFNNDPRLSFISWIYATRDDTAAHQLGMPPGYIVGGTNTAIDITKTPTYDTTLGIEGYSRLSSNMLSLTAPTLVLTYAESEFLLADANKRWGVGTISAETHYNNGVIAAITQLSVYANDSSISSTAAAAYLKAHPYNSTNALSQINTQFWLCTIMNEYEAWSNWRRTGYPALTPTNYPGNITSGTIPRRMQYPVSQKFTNGTNYNAAVTRLSNGDALTSRMWWDVK